MLSRHTFSTEIYICSRGCNFMVWALWKSQKCFLEPVLQNLDQFISTINHDSPVVWSQSSRPYRSLNLNMEQEKQGEGIVACFDKNYEHFFGDELWAPQPVLFTKKGICKFCQMFIWIFHQTFVSLKFWNVKWYVNQLKPVFNNQCSCSGWCVVLEDWTI